MLVALAVAAEPAIAACGGVKHANPTSDRVPGDAPPPLAIGDSVMLGAVEELAATGYEVNVRGCRQMSQGVRLIARRLQEGTLPGAVLVLLGANWEIYPHQIERALELLGPDRVLVLLTPRESGGGAGADARLVRAAGRRYPGRVVVLDWVAYGAGHLDWFGEDGLHLTPAGAAGLARLASRALPLALGPAEDDWTRSGAEPELREFGRASARG